VRIRRSLVISAAAVSSHEDSRPRISAIAAPLPHEAALG
jgi:hypothetical protein